MDYSQYLRLKQEAANVYIARTKAVDASLITLQKQQKAAYSGYNNIQSIPYFNGIKQPVLNNTTFDTSESCPKTHQYTQGYSGTNRLSQQEGQASRKAGAALCGDANYATAPPGIQLLNCSTVTTILTSHNNNTPAPGVWKLYGQNHYFPNPDSNSSCANCAKSQASGFYAPCASCDTNKTVFPSG